MKTQIITLDELDTQASSEKQKQAITRETYDPSFEPKIKDYFFASLAYARSHLDLFSVAGRSDTFKNILKEEIRARIARQHRRYYQGF